MATADDKTIQINFRVREGLRRRLERAAHLNGASLNNEMRFRLERSLEVESLRSVNDVADDIERNWFRFSERFLAREIEDDILTALEAREYDKARTLAVSLRKHQEASARLRAQKMADTTGADK